MYEFGAIMQKNYGVRLIYLVLTALLILPPGLATAGVSNPAISIIIDDIGYRIHDDLRAIAIPGPLAYAIMPHSPYAHKMSHLAIKNGKQVLLHLPMESIIPKKNRFLGPGALMLDMNKAQFMRTLNRDLKSLPEAIGVNNHMGSLLTSHAGHMEWLMHTLKRDRKFYIDSMTSRFSVAGTIARENNIPTLKRDVFLDDKLKPGYIESQFSELIRIAKEKGEAVAIGHPHPETIWVLDRELQNLNKFGVRLVSITDLMKIRSRIRKQNIVANSN